ncbi:MAG: hypothetical protein ABI591_27530 [Kofleriaceae bacterium]
MGNLRICIFGVVVAFAAACGGDGGTGIADECNPLGGQTCMLPWPSMAFTKVDATSATGFRVDAPIAAMPKNGDKISIDPKMINRWDGFSPTGPMLAIFPKGVTVGNLPSFKDPDQSLAADSPIVVLDIDTGERAPFFAEIDANFSEPGSSALIIRPLMRLHEKSHYAVAIRTAVKAADGSDLESPAGFVALRDGTGFDHPRFAAMQAGASAMFAALATAGVPKTDIVLAWDFVTASDQFLQSDLTSMRDAGVAAIGTNGANLSFVATLQPAIPGIYKAYVGTFKSPNFLSDAENDDSIFLRGDDGLPKLTGMRDANFAALIPQCVTTQPGPHATIVFGHGLFGSAKEYLADSFTQDLAEKYCFIIIAGDFIGLTSRQLTLASLSVNDLNVGYGITEKLGQSILDFVALENAVRGPMSTAPEFQDNNGQPVIDPAHTYYIGGSLGGIMGNVFMAYDPNITRGVLAVPGGVWSLLFERSNAWSLLQGALMGSYTDPKEYQLIIAMFGMAFEPYDSITTAAHVIKDPLPGVPVKNILMWYSMGDCLVNNLTTEMVARTMGITLIAPNVKDVWGMTPAPGPMANGINVFNDHPAPLPPDVNIPPAVDNGTHSGINRKAAALREVEAFILNGQAARQTCFAADGTTPAACDCATGACD